MTDTTYEGAGPKILKLIGASTPAETISTMGAAETGEGCCHVVSSFVPLSRGLRNSFARADGCVCTGALLSGWIPDRLRHWQLLPGRQLLPARGRLRAGWVVILRRRNDRPPGTNIYCARVQTCYSNYDGAAADGCSFAETTVCGVPVQ